MSASAPLPNSTPATTVDLVSAARSGAVSLLGSAAAAVAGLVLNVVIGRGLGATASGTFFVVVAVLTVAGTVGKLGADTGLVRALSRARTLNRTHDVRRTVLVAVVPSVAAGGLLAAAVFVLAGPIGAAIDGDAGTIADLLRQSAPFVLLAGPTMVLAAALRGFGSIVGFTLVQNVLVPGLRPLLAAVVIAAGFGVGAALLMWNLPFVLGVAVAVVLVARRGARIEREPGSEPRRPTGEIAGEFWRFSGPRAVAAVLEIALVWGDVLLVAALASPTEAGIYAAASRFITTGTLAEAALRIAMAPQVTRLLAIGDLAGTSRLCATATQWTVLLSWPLYLCLALYGPFVLALFGPEFTSGSVALAILSVAMLVVTAAGNNQTVLLMSGLAGRQMGNKAAALVLNIGLNLLLVPEWGMVGAAVAWGAAMVLDCGLALVQVRRRIGVRIPMERVLPAAAVTVFGVVPVGLAVRFLWGDSAVAAGAGIVLSVTLLGVLVGLNRRRLDVEALRRALPGGRAAPPD